jgi:hypothetical protein
MLRDEGREVNHHGTARKFDADGNEIIDDAEVEVWHSYSDTFAIYISTNDT